jgi:hypothetical protein
VRSELREAESKINEAESQNHNLIVSIKEIDVKSRIKLILLFSVSLNI